jgi:hypothetical protein
MEVFIIVIIINQFSSQKYGLVSCQKFRNLGKWNPLVWKLLLDLFIQLFGYKNWVWLLVAKLGCMMLPLYNTPPCSTYVQDKCEEAMMSFVWPWPCRFYKLWTTYMDILKQKQHIIPDYTYS